MVPRGACQVPGRVGVSFRGRGPVGTPPERHDIARHMISSEAVVAVHEKPHLLAVVALLKDLPEHRLVRGQVGTVVELLNGAYEVEFCDDEGITYAEVALEPDQLLVLHHRPRRAA